jgi:hypothetical protein
MFNLAFGKPKDDHILPLDGRELTRLINLRVERLKKCNCDHCTDFLTRIRFRGMLDRAKESEKKALKLLAAYSVEYELPEEARLSNFDLDERLEYTSHGPVIDELLEAERNWRKEHDLKCVDSDEYWLKRCHEIHNSEETDAIPKRTETEKSRDTKR